MIGRFVRLVALALGDLADQLEGPRGDVGTCGYCDTHGARNEWGLCRECASRMEACADDLYDDGEECR